jgi:hypothetical protein
MGVQNFLFSPFYLKKKMVSASFPQLLNPLIGFHERTLLMPQQAGTL